ncbi:MAG: DUF2946 family protein [Pseudomonadota bacterium]
MHALRNARHLARFLLVWFALYLGAAVASPILAPQGFELICSSAGTTKLLVKTGDGSSSGAQASAMDCPLCLPVGAPPPPAAATAVLPALPLAHVLRPVPAAHIAALTAAPPPGRGPPAFL